MFMCEKDSLCVSKQNSKIILNYKQESLQFRNIPQIVITAKINLSVNLNYQMKQTRTRLIVSFYLILSY